MKLNCPLRTAILIGIFLSTVMVFGAIQKPGEKVRGAAIEQYQTQEAHDAVQDINIDTLRSISVANAQAIQEIRDKMNLIMGGIGGFGGLLTFLQIYQLGWNPKKNAGSHERTTRSS